SRPARAGGMASPWTGVGRVKPSSRVARRRAGSRPRPVKGMSGHRCRARASFAQRSPRLGALDTLPAGSSLHIDRALAATCDHLLWGAADLEVAIAALAERTEVRATAGGQHPDLGTHNALAALGRGPFLEVIAP